MTSANHARAPKPAAARCEDRRRTGEQRPAWLRPYRRVQRALEASARLIDSTLRTVAASERCAHRRPIQTSGNLWNASGRLATASRRLMHAVEELAEANECIGREPERAAGVPALLTAATAQWMLINVRLETAAQEVFTFHDHVLDGLASGELVPERPAGRPRIILTPRPVPVRAFLAARQPRVADRIASILSRRRRTPRPAAVSVPRRNIQGRAPPLVSLCPL